jgi:hypothetical protein
MRKQLFLSSIFFSSFGFGQVGINTTTPNSSAVLDIVGKSGKQGVLLPKVNLISATDATTIASPAKGLTVFNTNGFIGEGIYVNEGNESSPSWQKMKTLQSEESSRIVSTLVYNGATTNATKILNTDIFQWRMVSDASGNYSLQMRLKAAPTANVTTTSTYTLNWRGTEQATLAMPSFTWSPTNWNIWYPAYTYQSNFETFYYFGVVGTDKLFRVNVYTVTNSINYLMIEQF